MELLTAGITPPKLGDTPAFTGYVPAQITLRSDIVNTYSGSSQKVFTFEQNQCSRSFRNTVHVRPEWVFTMLQNMQARLMLLIEGAFFIMQR
jgi:hypothetical protein